MVIHVWKDLSRAALLSGIALLGLAVPSAAQIYSQVIVFGDSNLDSGYYRALASPGGGATFNSYWLAGVAAGAGAPVSRPGLMVSEVLASYFGLTAIPANQPGGTNYATSGAKNADVNTSANGGFQAAIPTVTQIANYLSANGNVANPNAVYLIASGDNDVSFARGDSGTGPFPANPTTYLNSRANSLAMALSSLKTAGAQTILVKKLLESFPLNDATTRQYRATYNQALFSALTILGVGAIAFDFDATRLAMVANPSQFGFTTVSNAPANTACTVPAGVGGAWALLCSSNAGAPSQFVSPTADMTRLFADDSHMATAGQKIAANLAYGLLPAPTSSPLVSVILPASRSVQVGNFATAFSTIINAGSTTANGCQFSPVTNVSGRFSYQTTNALNQPTGTPNTPVSIPAGQAQGFVLAFQATAPFASADVRFVYVCTNTAAVVPIVGVNTLRLTIDANPVPDMIAVGLTPSADGYSRIPGPGGTGIFVIAATNIGISGQLTARARLSDPSIPATTFICQTDSNPGPNLGNCLSTPTTTVTTTINQNESTTWTAFIQANSTIAQDPATKRVFFEFLGAGNVVRGSTSTAITTQ